MVQHDRGVGYTDSDGDPVMVVIFNIYNIFSIPLLKGVINNGGVWLMDL